MPYDYVLPAIVGSACITVRHVYIVRHASIPSAVVHCIYASALSALLATPSDFDEQIQVNQM